MIYVKDSGVWKEVGGGGIELIAPPQGVNPSLGETDVVYGEFEGSGYFSLYNRPQKARQVRISLSPSMFPVFWDSGIVDGASTSVDVSFLNIGLPTSTTVYWQIRYQDVDGAWSRWSDVSFFVSASEIFPTRYGEPFEGGFYFGNITVGSDTYMLIIADKSAEAALQWKNSNANTSGTSSATDGWANTNAMNNTNHPAAKYCRDYRGGEFNDWYLPAKDELNQMWLNLPPNGGATPAPFKTGGAQAMTAEDYWTSTQNSSFTAWFQSFSDGQQTAKNKDISLLVRPVRRVIL